MSPIQKIYAYQVCVKYFGTIPYVYDDDKGIIAYGKRVVFNYDVKCFGHAFATRLPTMGEPVLFVSTLVNKRRVFGVWMV